MAAGPTPGATPLAAAATALAGWQRRRVETVIGQLTGRSQLKRVWARDAWHLWSRWLRTLLSHTMAVLLCQRAGLGSLQFANLITS